MKLDRVSLPDTAALHTLLFEQLDEFPGKVELLDEGLSSDYGPLCLGMDQDRRFVLLIASVDPDETMLVRTLGQMSWTARHQSFLARLYSQRRADPAKNPRVILVAPSFSRAMQEAVAFLGIDIELYQYRALEINHEKLLLLDCVWTPPQKPTAQSADLEIIGNRAPLRPTELTNEERRFFGSLAPKDLPT